MLWPWGRWVLPGGQIVCLLCIPWCGGHPSVGTAGRGLQNCHLPPVLLDICILEAVFFFFHIVCSRGFLFFLWNLLTHLSDMCNNGKLSCDIPNVLHCDRFFFVGYLGFKYFQYLSFSLCVTIK